MLLFLSQYERTLDHRPGAEATLSKSVLRIDLFELTERIQAAAAARDAQTVPEKKQAGWAEWQPPEGSSLKTVASKARTGLKWAENI